jgi:glyoxylase-like metal-dependent hydrolase (beta-lactamase superfamily II)
VTKTILTILIFACLTASALRADPLIPEEPKPYSADLWQRVRLAATAVPGPLPTEVRYVKIAETRRPLADIVEGGSQDEYVMARTAFQIVYPSGWVMIDAGMDLAVHKFFGMGREEPYWADRNEALQEALKKARLVVITHEHGDHIAGVIRSNARREIAAKTLLTVGQIKTLTSYPQMPEIKLTPELARDYIAVDYESYLPVAPGMVLVKAPGHTPGHQMIYVRLESGRDYLFIGDVAWAMRGVTELKLKPPSAMRRINEDAISVENELQWIKGVMDRDKVIVIPSHDDSWLEQLTARHLIADGLTLH